MAKLSPEVEAAIVASAKQYGVPEARLRRYVQIESGGDPRNVTGSYKGALQLSDQEFKRYGGGDIFNPADNIRAGTLKMNAEAAEFQKKFGRPPTDADLYLIHQQGWGGYQAHTARPDAPAWQNMAGTGEGRRKGADWAKAAIWGNVPDADKKRFGSVDNITSKDFVNLWSGRVGGSVEPAQAAAPTAPAQSPVAQPPPDALVAAMREPSAPPSALDTAKDMASALRGFSSTPAPEFTPLPTRMAAATNTVTAGRFAPAGFFKSR